MLKQRDIESQLHSKDSASRSASYSYRKSFIFFRSRFCNFVKRNAKILLVSILFSATLLYLLDVFIFMREDDLKVLKDNSSGSPGPHLYVQNPIFWKDIVSDARNKDDNDGVALSSLTDLVIVAGHAVYAHHSYRECTDAMNWRLFEHQRREKHLSAFLAHIAVGIDLTFNNRKALLMFSGGSTRTEVGPFSEGSTYWKVAEQCDYDGFSNFKHIQQRAFTEDYAMDSFQNILFSICRFYEITGNYPASITAISWSFKKTRFEKLHRRALNYPENQFHFKGVNGNVTLSDDAWKFEKSAIEQFKGDLFGCYLKSREIRIKRNPYFRSLPYPHQCPHMKQLFNICADTKGLESLQLHLPWST
mmetsp:Transcript_58901/g.97442  ORF Transcript_58901/g.97442 Transcript_58901/m.97442 type:complete len:361 (+) Transcript_58901:37-1119(+)